MQATFFFPWCRPFQLEKLEKSARNKIRKANVMAKANCVLDSHHAAPLVFVILMLTSMRVDQFNNTALLQLIIYPPNSIKLTLTWQEWNGKKCWVAFCIWQIIAVTNAPLFCKLYEIRRLQTIKNHTADQSHIEQHVPRVSSLMIGTISVFSLKYLFMNVADMHRKCFNLLSTLVVVLYMVLRVLPDAHSTPRRGRAGGSGLSRALGSAPHWYRRCHQITNGSTPAMFLSLPAEPSCRRVGTNLWQANWLSSALFCPLFGDTVYVQYVSECIIKVQSATFRCFLSAQT